LAVTKEEASGEERKNQKAVCKRGGSPTEIWAPDGQLGELRRRRRHTVNASPQLWKQVRVVRKRKPEAAVIVSSARDRTQHHGTGRPPFMRARSGGALMRSIGSMESGQPQPAGPRIIAVRRHFPTRSLQTSGNQWFVHETCYACLSSSTTVVSGKKTWFLLESMIGLLVVAIVGQHLTATNLVRPQIDRWVSCLDVRLESSFTPLLGAAAKWGIRRGLSPGAARAPVAAPLPRSSRTEAPGRGRRVLT
jgi:hypothetical protein